MKGPFHLKTERDEVPRDTVGVYLLAHRREGPVRYVGSTPAGGTLRSRLGDHASEGTYSWFWYEVRASRREALVRECELYAHYLPHGLDNQIRPPFCRQMGHEH